MENGGIEKSSANNKAYDAVDSLQAIHFYVLKQCTKTACLQKQICNINMHVQCASERARNVMAAHVTMRLNPKKHFLPLTTRFFFYSFSTSCVIFMARVLFKRIVRVTAVNTIVCNSKYIVCSFSPF